MTPRRKKDQHLPARVYMKHGAFYYVDKAGKWNRLGKDYYRSMTKWAALTAPSVQSPIVADLIDRYLIEIAPTKAKKTQRGIQAAAKFLRAGLGKLDARSITKQTVYAYMDHRLSSKKNPTTVSVINAEIRYFSAMLSKAVRWGAIDKNPCIGLEFEQAPARTRYVTDQELQAFRDFASPVIQDYLDFKLLTGLRKTDILQLRLEDLREDGIHVQPSKTSKTTGKRLIIEWSPALRLVVDRIRSRKQPKKVQRIDAWRHLFNTRTGGPYTDDGFNSVWQRQKRKAIKAKIISENFIDTDIRAKAATDTDLEHAQRLLGHADSRTTRAHYRRKPEKVKPIK